MLKKTLIIVLLLSFTACTLFKKKEKDSNILVIGTNTPFAPYEVINEQGEFEGFDIDLAKEIAKKLNKKIIFKDMSFDMLIINLQNKKIDMILAGVSITQDKLKEISMVCYLENDRTHYPIVFWKEIPKNIQTISDIKNLKNRTISVQAGTIQEQYLEQNNFITIKNIESVSDLILEVKHKKSIAFCIDMPVFKKLKNQIPELQALFVSIPEKHKSLGDGIGMRKDNIELIKEIEAIIREFKQNGILKDLKEKWFGNIRNNEHD